MRTFYLIVAVLASWLLLLMAESPAYGQTETPPATVSPTATAEPTQPTATPTAVAPSPTFTPTAGDVYEPDAPPYTIPAYAGPQLRSFHPATDVDYVRYRAKGGLTHYLTTQDLTGSADTLVCVYRDDDGELTADDPLLLCDDDGNGGLASRVVLTVSADMNTTIVITNKALAFGPSVGYTFRIVDSASATPTPTATFLPTATPYPTVTPYPTYTPYPSPTPSVPTLTPYPTYTPYPSPTPLPTAVYRPPTSSSGSGGESPATAVATVTVAETSNLARVQVFTDTNDNKTMDVGEGANNLLVRLVSPDLSRQLVTYTIEGVAVFVVPADWPTTTASTIDVPYLYRSLSYMPERDNGGEIALAAPLFPVYLP